MCTTEGSSGAESTIKKKFQESEGKRERDSKSIEEIYIDRHRKKDKDREIHTNIYVYRY